MSLYKYMHPFFPGLYMRLLTCIIIFSPFGRLVAQQEISQLQNQIKQTSNAKVKSQLSNQLGQFYLESYELDSALVYAQQALNLSQKNEWPDEQANAHLLLGEIFFSLENLPEAARQFDLAIEVAQIHELAEAYYGALNARAAIYNQNNEQQAAMELLKNSLILANGIGDTARLTQTINQVATNYYALGQLDSARHYFEQLLSLKRKANDMGGLVSDLGNLSLLFKEQGDYDRAQYYLIDALGIVENMRDTFSQMSLLTEIADLYVQQKSPDKAIEYADRAYTLATQKGITLTAANCLSHKAAAMILKQNIPEAVSLYEQALESFSELGNKVKQAETQLAIGKLLQKEDFHTDARKYLEEALTVREEIGDRVGQLQVQLAMAEVSIQEEKFRQAIKLLEDCRELARETGSKTGLQDSYQLLTIAYERTGRLKKALETQQEYIKIKDQIFTEENTRIIQELGTKYETQKKESEILQLKMKSTQGELLAQRAQRRQNVFLLSSGLLLLLIFVVFWYFRYKQKKREVKLEKEQVSKLRELDKLKDQFLANTSHELRTPLNGIIGLAESLQERDLPEDQRTNLSMIVASGKRLANLVNDLLDVSRLKNQSIDIHPKAVDLYVLSNFVIESVKPLVSQKALKLDNQISQDFPALWADEDRLQQILFNIIGNAIKFTHEGSITLAVEPKEKMATLSVRDTGIGIAKDKLNIIFEDFEQGDGSISRSYGGTGLGLSITRKLVNLHGGEIWVDSQLGVGSTFFASLPLATDEQINEFQHEGERLRRIGELDRFQQAGEEERTEQDSSESSSPIMGVSSDAKAGHILIVDDEPVNQQVLKSYLQPRGFHVVSAIDGLEALELFRNGHAFDLVLLDLMMPRMSGYEVCEEIRKSYLPSELPVIMITAKNQVQDLVRGFEVGANDYITKPFNKEELLARIHAHLDLHQIHSATVRFVPREFIKSLGHESIRDVRLGDQVEQIVTVQFSDIRNYTAIAEAMTPEDNFRFVSDYVRQVGPFIQKNGGFVNQYLGDGIMAIFQHGPAQALRAARDMQQTIWQLNQKNHLPDYVELKTGIGLHTGSLIMGIIGDDKRTDAATISDTVNTASRMEGLTKVFGANILLSEATYKQLENPGEFAFRYLGKVQVKGKNKSLGVYECLDGLPEEVGMLILKTRDLFSEGVNLYYARDFDKATKAFKEVLHAHPSDRAAAHFLGRSIQYLSDGVPDNWTGVEMVETK